MNKNIDTGYGPALHYENSPNKTQVSISTVCCTDNLRFAWVWLLIVTQILPQRRERSMISSRSVSILHPANVTIRQTIHQRLNAACSECCIQKHEGHFLFIRCNDNRLSCYSFYSHHFLLRVRTLHFIINASYYKSRKVFEDNLNYLKTMAPYLLPGPLILL